MSDNSNRAPLRTFADAIAFYWPLAATQLMMAVGQPVINGALAGIPDAALHLAVFAVCFQLALLFNALCFGMEHAATHLIRDRVSFRRFLFVAGGAGLGLSALQLSFGLTPLGRLVLTDVMGFDAAVAEMGRPGMAVFGFVPFMLALRSTFRGVHVRRGGTRDVGRATLVRVLLIVVLAYTLVRLFPAHGAVMGLTAQAAGIAVEAVVVMRSALPWARALPEAAGPSRSPAAIAAFIAPLALSSASLVAVGPLTHAVLARGADPRTAVAAFNVDRSLTWLLASAMFAVQGIVIARGRDAEERALVRRFVATLTLGVTALSAFVAVPPVGRALLGGWMGVRPPVLDAAVAALVMFPLGVLLMGLRLTLNGCAVREDRPGDPLVGGLIGLGAAAAVGLLVLDRTPSGAHTAAVMWIALNAVECAWLALRRVTARRASTVTAA